MKKCALYFLLFLFSINLNSQNEPLTIAEQSDYSATANYDEVLQFISELQDKHPALKVENIGSTIEGRQIPLLVLGHDDHQEKLTVYIQANIHAGEVEGKEAALMLARDLLADEESSILNELCVLICPNLNADGNEKMSTTNRKHQNGPKSVGIRYNGQNLDLNRDAMKLESPEMQAVVTRIFNKYDPAITVDCHTTNGSYHEEPITFTWMMNPNGNRTLINYMRDQMMPKVSKRLANHHHTLNCFYGEFIDRLNPHKGWISYAAEPRYMVNYIGLRNRLSILNENYVYADYKTRVIGCYKLLQSIVEYALVYKQEINDLLTKADQDMVDRFNNAAQSDSFAIEYKEYPTPEKVTIKAFEATTYTDENGRKHYKNTGRPITITTDYLADYFPTKSIKVPYAYILTVSDPDIINNLNIHGIQYEVLKKQIELKVEQFSIDSLKPVTRLNQGHYTNHIYGQFQPVEKAFIPGAILIRTDQKLGNLVSYLLEPQADDGLLKWNYFDKYLAPQWGRGFYPYPVYRLMDKFEL
jgi:hypothetical protein